MALRERFVAMTAACLRTLLHSVCSLALVVLAVWPVQAACTFQKRAEAAVYVREGFPFVAATIAGTPISMLLDTGAQGMLLTPEAVTALRLPIDPGRSTRLLGTGGDRDAPNVILRGLELGGARFTDSSVPVADLPGVPRTEPPLAGLLGAPLLSSFDVDLDIQNGRITLYDALGCGASLPPIPPPYSVLPLEVTAEGEAFLPVQVNGVRLTALIDTGSRATILTEQAAQRIGLAGPGSANVARGIDGAPMPVRHLRVSTLQVGTEVLRNAPVSVSPLQLGRGDMLLGFDYLGRRRVWISYHAGHVVISAASRS
jgi:predicted aspartyl protease